jgi:hypothetical protein
MLSMGRRRWDMCAACATVALCLALSLSPGCARSGDVHRTGQDADSPASEQKLPFHQNSDHASDDGARPSVPSGPIPGGTAPFRAASSVLNLPAGTLVTVQLDGSLPISQVHPGDSFTASLAGPLLVDGNTLVEPGAPVIGHVESAQPPEDRPGLSRTPGYVRLTLNTITVGGRTLALHTSSLFARCGSQSGNTAVYSPASLGERASRLQKGRHLTFRLTAPVALADPNAIADRRDLSHEQ